MFGNYLITGLDLANEIIYGDRGCHVSFVAKDETSSLFLLNPILGARFTCTKLPGGSAHLKMTVNCASPARHATPE